MVGRIDEAGFVASRHKTHEAQLRPNVQPTEMTMQKTALTVFGVLLISGMAVQMAAASEHHRSKAYFGRDISQFRGAYNQANGQINGPVYVVPQVFDNPYKDRDPSWVGGRDPSLNPAGN
jgi:hypothetical protein